MSQRRLGSLEKVCRMVPSFGKVSFTSPTLGLTEDEKPLLRLLLPAWPSAWENKVLPAQKLGTGVGKLVAVFRDAGEMVPIHPS